MIQESSTVLGKREIFISIVLPCYNEGIHLPNSLESLSQFLNSLNKEYEIIVSDDGSNDTTPNLDWQKYSSDFYVKYMPSNSNTGKGAALKRGLQACQGKFVFFTDADLPVKLEAVIMSLSILENNESDMVIGDRRLAGSKAIGSAPIRRRIASMVFNFGVQLLALPGYTDTQCCMKAFTKEALQKVLPETFLTSYAFDVELVYLAKLHNLRIKRIPVFWKDARANVSLKRLTHIILSSLKEVAYVRFRKR